MHDSHGTFGETIDALRSATLQLGRVRDELGWEDGQHARIDGQLFILDGVLDELERLYDEALDTLR
jgi:hypothetical protein